VPGMEALDMGAQGIEALSAHALRLAKTLMVVLVTDAHTEDKECAINTRARSPTITG
jgi:hypothetical protein